MDQKTAIDQKIVSELNRQYEVKHNTYMAVDTIISLEDRVGRLETELKELSDYVMSIKQSQPTSNTVKANLKG